MLLEQDILDAEDQRRPDDCVGEGRLLDRRLDHRFAAEIRQGRRRRRVGNTDVHELAHARSGGSFDHDARVRDRAVETLSAVWKSDPVGIENSAGALETSREIFRAIEIERR